MTVATILFIIIPYMCVVGYIITMYYCLIEIIREARINGPNLTELLKTPINQLEDDCLNNALL